ncbi:hypothetical protein GCM10007094_17170 [Pseudovibrio japonicus]|uniref:DUF998 domain-containing protein n=1 Tax=Pseudovibrio japonicus TaxID=366534 RepID=A0ABQ3E999_9HYPH|nr:DUF998 domain-containing protein [Pseudovibrio japonicus]GHB29047.1 hypothetical protein GCM10007094_17170 [Pseudovibrio japonicus]
MRHVDIAISLVVVSYIWLAATVVIGGQFYPDYNHISQFMSALGATGAPFGPTVNYWGFAVVELLLLPCLVICFARLMRSRAERIGLSIFAGYPLLISVAAFFPCDFECSMDDPTRSQLIHTAAGFLAYFCAVVGLCLLSHAQAERPYWVVPGLILLALLMSMSVETAVNGFLQRALETGVYLWFVWILVRKRQYGEQVA